MNLLRRVILVSGLAASLAVAHSAACPAAFADDAPQSGQTSVPSTWAVPSASAPPPVAPATPVVAPPSPASTVSTPAPPTTTVSAGKGVAVLALAGATDPAWRLAARVYRGPLRPSALDEAHARALVGETPPPSAARDVQDLAETRGAIHGEDAPSRRLLASLAAQLGVEAIVVVQKDGAEPATARVFLASNGAFDAARYAEDNGSWEPTAASLERTLKADSRVVAGPTGAGTTAPAEVPVAPGGKGEPPPSDGSKPFYRSVWFWGALGAAVFAGGAIFLATRDNGDGTGPMHVQMKVPR